MQAKPKVRAPAVAGRFYPAEAPVLRDQVSALLAAAAPRDLSALPRAIMVPHAGYVYSGSVAAQGYRTVAHSLSAFDRVVLLGPAHRVALQGVALPGVDAFATPLGISLLDEELAHALASLPDVQERPDVHRLEHSLEVQLPFLQHLAPSCPVLPLAVGRIRPEKLAELLARCTLLPRTLLVLSSDLSHFLPYETACALDASTMQKLEQGDLVQGEQACGASVLNGFSLWAKQHNLQPKRLALLNSGDTAGSRHEVVGYGAMAWYDPAQRAS